MKKREKLTTIYYYTYYLAMLNLPFTDEEVMYHSSRDINRLYLKNLVRMYEPRGIIK